MRFWPQPSVVDYVNFMSADDQDRVLVNYRQNYDRLVQIKIDIVKFDISPIAAQAALLPFADSAGSYSFFRTVPSNANPKKADTTLPH
jgi:hypothetical protein